MLLGRTPSKAWKEVSCVGARPKAAFSSATWGDGGYRAALAEARRGLPRDAMLYDVRAEGLVTASGESNKLPVAVVSTAGTVPRGPAKIRTNLLRAADDGSFPTGSTAPFAGGDFGEYQDTQHAEWVYALHFMGERIGGDEDAGTVMRQCNAGTFTGHEIHCPQENCVRSESYPDICACSDMLACDINTTVPCHEISGTYKLSTQDNSLQFTVDRRKSGGELEINVGGWTTENGSNITTQSDQPATRIVARSQRTGIQLMIVHYE